MSESQEYVFNESVRDPLVDKQYAYFKVSSEDVLEDIEALLGLTPSRQWNVGEIVQRSRKTFERRNSRWQLESGLSELSSIAEHLFALIELLEPKSKEIRQLAARYTCSIVCVSFSAQSFGGSINANLLRRLAALRIDLEFDLYALMDPHDEIVEARSLTLADAEQKS